MRFPNWYAWLALVISVMASVGLNVLISVELSRRAAQTQRETVCEIARTQDSIYKSNPPSTETGRAAAIAWENARIRWCKE